MKKWMLLVLCLVLCGCSGTAYETIGDEYLAPDAPKQAQLVLVLPEDAAVQTMQSQDEKSLYFFPEFTLERQTFSAGDLDKTLRSVTGYSREKLSLMQRSQGGVTRYDFVWSCAGEGGDQLCRGSILDDGSYHYALSVMAPDAQEGSLRQVWNDIFTSFSIAPKNEDTAP